MADVKRPDVHGNVIAVEGCTRCWCGCKYWENDRCVDCGEHASTAPENTPCAACNAEAGEPCRPGCIGKAAHDEGDN